MSGGGKKGGGIPNVPSEGTFLASPITFYRDRTGLYPSNVQVWWSMKRPPEVGTDRPPKQYLEVFDPGLRHQVSSGNTPVAKGHFILDAFRQDRSAASGVPNLPVKTSNGNRPSAVGFFAGRTFYSGLFTYGFNTKIWFTQILERPDQVNDCFQTSDPTAEEIRDLLPSDGGEITIPEVHQVIALWAFGQHLFVMASNGVWSISGSNGTGFMANDYSIQKLSGVPSISNLSFTSVEGAPIWWNRSSINTIQFDEQGNPQVVSLTDDSIKTFYDLIPEQSKFNAKGTYDALTKKVQFLYRSTETEEEAELFNYDSILTLDTRNGSWSPWNLRDEPRVDIKGLFTLEGNSVEQQISEVLADQDEVFANDGKVYTIYEYRRVVQSKVKYIVNILSETVLPNPPDPSPIEPLDVFVLDDNVESNSFQVQVNP